MCGWERVRLNFGMVIYHFGLLLLEGAETLPPAHDPTLGLHQVTADLVETLLLLGGPDTHDKLIMVSPIKTAIFPCQ